jgi:hypothetical protein
VSSKNKRYGTNQKINQAIEIDINIKSKDYGMAFLKHYATLECEEIVVLHPLSYLIKQANFKQLGFFTNQYKLENAIIFSSSEFGTALKDNKTQFPIICAKYTKGSMNYDYIKSFYFKVLNQENTFSIKDLYTIDDYGIRKYPASKNMVKESDINLYHYNIRDMNSLKTSGNFSSIYNHNMITVQFENLYQYAYLNCYRRYFPNDFLLGNISPICDKKMLENQEFRDICIMDLIINNQSLEPLSIKNKDSFLYKNFVINDFRRKIKNDNLYQKFIDFVDNSYDARDFFKAYFEEKFKRLHQHTLL